METVATRLKALRESIRPKPPSIRQMADRLGFENHNRYNYYETKFTGDVLPRGLASKIADIFEGYGIDREDVLRLATGIEPDLPDEGAAPGRLDPVLLDKFHLVEIPVVDVEYSMGDVAFLSEYAHAGFKYFDREWIETATRADPAFLRFARGIGDSMFPTIQDSDALLINTAETTIDRQDRIWALAYGGLGMIKRVRQLPTPAGELRQFLIISDNPAVENFTVSSDELVVVGRVVWIGRKV
jgi:phage repressor protein C with HTH and peptisase S24 domain